MAQRLLEVVVAVWMSLETILATQVMCHSCQLSLQIYFIVRPAHSADENCLVATTHHLVATITEAACHT